MLKISAILICFLLVASCAIAQIPTKGNVFVGYSYGRFNFSAPVGPADGGATVFANPSNLNGWNGSLEGKIFPFIGIVADLSGYYGSPDFTSECGLIISCSPQTGRATARVYNVLFGPRVSVSVGKITPFAHALVGFGHVSETASTPVSFSNSATSFAEAFGGGIDYKLLRGIGWRVQADFLQSHFFSTSQNNFRFSTGLVFRF